MKHVLLYLKKYRKETILAPLFKMLEASLELFVPLVMADIIDIGIAGGDNSVVIQKSLVLIGLAFLGLTASITAQYFAAKAAVGCAASLRAGLFEHIQSFSCSTLDKIGTSTLITRLSADTAQVQNGVNMVLRLFLRSPFIVLGAMIMAFTVDQKGAVIFVVLIPALSIVVFGIMGITIPLYRKVSGKLDSVLLSTRENLSGVRVIRAFGKENAETDSFDKKNDILTRASEKVGRISALLNPLTLVIVNIATAVLIYVGAIRVDSGNLSQGQVVALVNYMSQILVELVKLANLIVTITKSLASARRIEEVFGYESKEDGEVTELNKDGNTPFLSFENVSLKYSEGADEALSGISFEARMGETIGIIGGTGSGKSSVVNLIAGLYNATDGTVMIGGRNAESVSPGVLLQNVSLVPQKAVLFKGTIRENLLMGAGENVTEEDIMQALKVSQSYDFVMEKGLDFVVEGEGKNLSGGQRQRLCIARALLRKGRVLILDDSSSALDYATDAALRKAVAAMPGDRIIVTVSQRTSSVMHADRILVLDDGRLAGIGTHEKLLKSCEVYREIHESQFGKEEKHEKQSCI